MRQRRSRNNSGSSIQDAKQAKSEKIYKLAPILNLATDGKVIYGRLTADTLKDGQFKSYAPVAKIVPDVPYLDENGKQQTGFDVQDAAGNSFLQYPQETVHKAVLYASRKFVSSEVSRLFPVDSEKQTLKQQLDTAAVLKTVYKAILKNNFQDVTADMLSAVKDQLDADELAAVTKGLQSKAAGSRQAAGKAGATDKTK
jgi:hypothetical protein